MNDEKKIELNKHPDEEADKWDMKTSTRWVEIPDEWTDKSTDLNKHPDKDDLHIHCLGRLMIIMTLNSHCWLFI